jgi:hypothetical protein
MASLKKKKVAYTKDATARRGIHSYNPKFRRLTLKDGKFQASLKKKKKKNATTKAKMSNTYKMSLLNVQLHQRGHNLSLSLCFILIFSSKSDRFDSSVMIMKVVHDFLSAKFRRNLERGDKSPRVNLNSITNGSNILFFFFLLAVLNSALCTC